MTKSLVEYNWNMVNDESIQVEPAVAIVWGSVVTKPHTCKLVQHQKLEHVRRLCEPGHTPEYMCMDL